MTRFIQDSAPVFLVDEEGDPIGLSTDAFHRLRISSPEFVFDAQQTYDDLPLLFDKIVSGTGAAQAFDATNRCSLLTFAATPNGGKAYMQSFEALPYQPGRSQLAYATFNFNGEAANTLKFVGLSDGSNGVELQLNAVGGPRVALLSTTGLGNQFVDRTDWIDKLDGLGRSGVNIDWTMGQIFAVDVQALYMGRVRAFLDIDGKLVKFVEVDHANKAALPYIASANLPIRAGMTCSGASSTTMRFVCSTVISEGGQVDPRGFDQSSEGTITAANGTDTHILSVRPKLTFNSIVNRAKFVLDSVSIVNTGSNPVIWKLAIGQAFSPNPTFNSVNAYSTSEAAAGAATLSGSPAIVLRQGYCAASNQAKESIVSNIPMRYPITLDAAGLQRVLGTLTVLVQGVGGTSACRAALNWREIR